MAEVWGEPGGILALLDLIEEHPGAVAYDFRTRFPGLSVSAVGTAELGWTEAVHLVTILRNDPSSMITAAMEGWTHPVSREALIAMDQYDLTYAATGAKKKHQYPRPFKTDRKVERMGNTGGRSPEAVRALLARARNGEDLDAA